MSIPKINSKKKFKSFKAKNKINKKNGQFFDYFICNIGQILKVLAAPQKSNKTIDIFFELILGIDTAVCEIEQVNSGFCKFHNTLVFMWSCCGRFFMYKMVKFRPLI